VLNKNIRLASFKTGKRTASQKFVGGERKDEQSATTLITMNEK
jgi:hypothetical protein